MSDVSVIGLGEMGSALARAFLAAGKSVTVWNRSPAKAEALAQKGALRAGDPAAAAAASPALVICVSDYAATNSILAAAGVAEKLKGRLVVQLTSGLPKEARALAAWTKTQGADYLDGAIGSWPRQIGTPDAAILVAGDDGLFASAEPLLKLLAGGLTFVGSDISHAKILFNAGLSYFAGHWIGFAQGAAICEAEGLDIAAFGDMMAGMAPGLAEDMRHMGNVIAQGRYDNPESSVKTVGADIARLVELSADLKIGGTFPAVAAGLFQRAVDAGYGGEEHGAVVKVLRSA